MDGECSHWRALISLSCRTPKLKLNERMGNYQKPLLRFIGVLSAISPDVSNMFTWPVDRLFLGEITKISLTWEKNISLHKLKNCVLVIACMFWCQSGHIKNTKSPLCLSKKTWMNKTNNFYFFFNWKGCVSKLILKIELQLLLTLLSLPLTGIYASTRDYITNHKRAK